MGGLPAGVPCLKAEQAEPERRFSEDALRILRALRFSARLGFPIEERTDGALRAGRSMLQKISRERIAAELTGLLMGKDAGSVLCRYPEVIVTVLPEMKPLTESGLWRRALKRIDRSPRDEIIRWAALLMDAADSGEAHQVGNIAERVAVLPRTVEELRFGNPAQRRVDAEESVRVIPARRRIGNDDDS